MTIYNGTDIKYLLEKKGYSLSDVARELGVTPQCVSQAIWGKYPSSRAVAYIERLLGMKPGTLHIKRDVKRFPRSKVA